MNLLTTITKRDGYRFEVSCYVNIDGVWTVHSRDSHARANKDYYRYFGTTKEGEKRAKKYAKDLSEWRD